MAELFHLEVMLSSSTLHRVMTIIEGAKGSRILNLGIAKHGGVNDDTGDIQARPTGRDFLMAFAASRKQFTVTEAAQEGERLGLNKTTLTSVIGVMKREKLLKHVGLATYAMTQKANKTAKLPKAGARANGKINGKPIVGAGADLVTKLVASGDIHVAKIKDAFVAAKMSAKTVTNLVSKMVKTGQLQQTGRGMYAKGA